MALYELPDEIWQEVFTWFGYVDPNIYGSAIFVSKTWYKLLIALRVPITNYRERHAAHKRCDYWSLTGAYPCKYPDDDYLLLEGAKRGRVALVEYLMYDLNGILAPRFVYRAYKGGHPEIIAMIEGFTSNSYKIKALQGACAGGHLELVKSLLPIQVFFTEYKENICYAAAKSGNAVILELLKKYNLFVLQSAVDGSALAQRWLLFNKLLPIVLASGGGTKILQLCLDNALKKGEVNAVRVLLQHFVPNDWVSLFHSAIDSGNAELITLCYENLQHNERKVAIKYGFSWNNYKMTLEMVQFIIPKLSHNRSMLINLQCCLNHAEIYRYTDIVDYLRPVVQQWLAGLKLTVEQLQSYIEYQEYLSSEDE